jgi:hypothetical protein
MPRLNFRRSSDFSPALFYGYHCLMKLPPSQSPSAPFQATFRILSKLPNSMPSIIMPSAALLLLMSALPVESLHSQV